MDCLARGTVRSAGRRRLRIPTRPGAAGTTLALLCGVLLLLGGCSKIKIEPPSLGMNSCLSCGMSDRP